MFEYAAVFHAGYHYYFGGKVDSSILNSVLQLEESSWTWSNVGQMKKSRFLHGVIMIGDRFMVLGGREEVDSWERMPNEDCLMNDGKVTCTEYYTGLDF